MDERNTSKQEAQAADQYPGAAPTLDDRILGLLSQTNLVEYALGLGARGGTVPHDDSTKEKLATALESLAQQGPVLPGERDPRIRGLLERTGMDSYVTGAENGREGGRRFPPREARLAVLSALAESFGMQEPPAAHAGSVPRRRVVRWLTPPAEITKPKDPTAEPTAPVPPRRPKNKKDKSREQLYNRTFENINVLLALKGQEFDPLEVHTLYQHIIGNEADTGTDTFRRPAHHLLRALRLNFQLERQYRNNGMPIKDPLTQLDMQLLSSLLGDYYDFARPPLTLSEIAENRNAQNPGTQQDRNTVFEEVCAVLNRAASRWSKPPKADW